MIQHIRLSNFDNQKKEVVKLILSMKLIKYYGKVKSNVYTLFPLVDNDLLDVYFENFKIKQAIGFKILDSPTEKYKEEIEKLYKDVSVYSLEFKLVIINLNDLPENITDLNKVLEKYV